MSRTVTVMNHETDEDGLTTSHPMELELDDYESVPEQYAHQCGECGAEEDAPHWDGCRAGAMQAPWYTEREYSEPDDDPYNGGGYLDTPEYDGDLDW